VDTLRNNRITPGRRTVAQQKIPIETVIFCVIMLPIFWVSLLLLLHRGIQDSASVVYGTLWKKHKLMSLAIVTLFTALLFVFKPPSTTGILGDVFLALVGVELGWGLVLGYYMNKYNR
jgi:hypothetical protein